MKAIGRHLIITVKCIYTDTVSIDTCKYQGKKVCWGMNFVGHVIE